MAHETRHIRDGGEACMMKVRSTVRGRTRPRTTCAQKEGRREGRLLARHSGQIGRVHTDLVHRGIDGMQGIVVEPVEWRRGDAC